MLAAAAVLAAEWPSTALILLAAWVAVVVVEPLLYRLSPVMGLVLRVLATPTFFLAMGISLLASHRTGTGFWAGVAATTIGGVAAVLLVYELHRLNQRRHADGGALTARHSS